MLASLAKGTYHVKFHGDRIGTWNSPIHDAIAYLLDKGMIKMDDTISVFIHNEHYLTAKVEHIVRDIIEGKEEK
jgi:hypothetical protein